MTPRRASLFDEPTAPVPPDAVPVALDDDCGGGPEVVTLRDGVDVPLPALQLLWRLESLGVAMSLDGEDVVARPKSRVSPADAALLRAHIHAVKRLLRYVPPEVQ
jgi:hypothetical protein